MRGIHFLVILVLVTSIIALLFTTYHFFGSPAGFAAASAQKTPELLQFTWPPALFIGLTLTCAFFALTNTQVSQHMYIVEQELVARRFRFLPRSRTASSHPGE